ncbi:MAG: hypothetical protein ACRDRO_28105 [Pseudonocardiaceae bacterium]
MSGPAAAADGLDLRDRGRAAYRQGAWSAAFSQLAAADRESPLDPADLDLLVTAAYRGESPISLSGGPFRAENGFGCPLTSLLLDPGEVVG